MTVTMFLIESMLYSLCEKLPKEEIQLSYIWRNIQEFQVASRSTGALTITMQDSCVMSLLGFSISMKFLYTYLYIISAAA